MISVASQPSIFSLRRIVNVPITSGLAPSIIMTAMIGTAITPLITAVQKSALIGSILVKFNATPPMVAKATIA